MTRTILATGIATLVLAACGGGGSPDSSSGGPSPNDQRSYLGIDADDPGCRRSMAIIERDFGEPDDRIPIDTGLTGFTYLIEDVRYVFDSNVPGGGACRTRLLSDDGFVDAPGAETPPDDVAPMSAPVSMPTPVVEPAPAARPTPVTQPAPVAQPAPVTTPTPEPTPVAQVPQPAPAPAPEPVPAPTPEPQPAPEPATQRPVPEPMPEPEPAPAPQPAPVPGPSPAPEPAPAQEPQPTPERVEGREVIGDTVVEAFSPTRGIGVSIIRYGFSRFGAPEATVRITNGSGGPIYNANCDIAAFRGNTIVDTANAFFAGLDPIDVGESALDAAAWRDLTGFGDIDRIRVDCDWLDGDDDRIDIVSGPVTAEFAGYRSSLSGKPAVALRLTNDSGVTIYNAACGVEAKRGNVILDVAQLFFADLGDIRPGEAAEEEGTWFELDSLGEFDSEPFDLGNVNCTRLVRR